MEPTRLCRSSRQASRQRVYGGGNGVADAGRRGGRGGGGVGGGGVGGGGGGVGGGASAHRTAETCRKEPQVLHEIVKGAQVATKECQFQFRNRRWNCTTARKGLRKVLARGRNHSLSLSLSLSFSFSSWIRRDVLRLTRSTGAPTNALRNGW